MQRSEKRSRIWVAPLLVLLLVAAATPSVWTYISRLRDDTVDELLNRRRFRDALRTISLRLKTRKNDSELYAQRAYAHWAMGSFLQASKAVSDADDCSRPSGLSKGVRALMHTVSGEVDEALAEANGYVAAANKDWRSYWIRAVVFRDSQRWSAAITELESAQRLAREPHQQAMCHAARASILLREDTRGALREADLAIQVAPQVPAGYLMRAIALERIQDFASSRNDLERYASLAPEEGPAARMICKAVAAGALYSEQLVARIRYAAANPPGAAMSPRETEDSPPPSL